MARVVQQASERDRARLAQAERAAIDEYSECLVVVRKVGKRIVTWTTSQAEADLETLDKSAETLAATQLALGQVMSNLQAARSDERKKRASEAGEAAKQRSRQTSVYKGNGVERMVRLLHEKGARADDGQPRRRRGPRPRCT